MPDVQINEQLRSHLACPRDYSKLELRHNRLVCEQGHAYPIVNGVPIFLVEEQESTLKSVFDTTYRSLEHAHEDAEMDDQGQAIDAVDPFVQDIIAATNGYLYVPLRGKLTTYPIPDIRLPEVQDQILIDIGCNWGRWSISAARKGYRVIGIDPSITAVLAAKRVAKQLGLDIHYVVGDARFLPFATASCDVAFSYSVLQHFSKENARLSLRSVGRVLKDGGLALIQLPHTIGLRNIHNRIRNRGSQNEFRVRYWSLREIRASFEELIGPTTLTVDGYFGLGIQAADVGLLPLHYQIVVRTSETLRMLNKYAPALIRVADSIYAHAVKEEGMPLD